MKKNILINTRIDEEEKIKISKVAQYLQRTESEILRLAAMEVIEREYNKILIDESNGITKKAIFRTEEI